VVARKSQLKAEEVLYQRLEEKYRKGEYRRNYEPHLEVLHHHFMVLCMRMSPVMGGVPFMGVFFMGFLLSHGIHLSQSKRETLIDLLFPKWKILPDRARKCNKSKQGSSNNLDYQVSTGRFRPIRFLPNGMNPPYWGENNG
jgi:hypothetical protein